MWVDQVFYVIVLYSFLGKKPYIFFTIIDRTSTKNAWTRDVFHWLLCLSFSHAWRCSQYDFQCFSVHICEFWKGMKPSKGHGLGYICSTLVLMTCFVLTTMTLVCRTMYFFVILLSYRNLRAVLSWRGQEVSVIIHFNVKITKG